MTQTALSPAASYLQYLSQNGLSLNAEVQAHLLSHFETTAWETPQSSLDCNNIAVAALLEAHYCKDKTMRGLYLGTAVDALQNSPSNHPLCVAHLALIQELIGETDAALQIAFEALLKLLQMKEVASEPLMPGLVYLPPSTSKNFQSIVSAEDGYTQAMLLLAEVIERSQRIFYNHTGQRMLNLVAQIMPHSSSTLLKLGISQLVGQQWEGLIPLHRARQLASNDAQILQALFLAYRDLGELETANFWLEVAQTSRLDDKRWKWADSTVHAPITYLPFDTNLLLAVEPSFRSIVTSVLLGAGDWFEREMEFWRDSIQPGMTVIDVGANVGVYTFSAAKQVGTEGRVLAIEPFSGCVRCLQETVRINQFDQVTVCAGAASDRNSTVKLAIQGASELNEVITGDAPTTGEFEEVACFTLDSLVEAEQLSRVDYLKIDAEGHEMQVLLGSDRILREFKPVILYENIAGSKGSNLPVAEYLLSKGYALFRYQPYLNHLIPASSAEELQGNLNIIALPTP
jgi:FkbM family methyltransferase